MNLNLYWTMNMTKRKLSKVIGVDVVFAKTVKKIFMKAYTAKDTTETTSHKVILLDCGHWVYMDNDNAHYKKMRCFECNYYAENEGESHRLIKNIREYDGDNKTIEKITITTVNGYKGHVEIYSDEICKHNGLKRICLICHDQ